MTIRGILLIVVLGGLAMACIAALALGGLAWGVDDHLQTKLTEAEADLTRAQAEELQRQSELLETQAKLEKAEAEAEAVRSTTDELVKHSRLNRRLLSWYAIRSNLFTALSIANLAMWGIGFYLHWRQR
jgi:multidrug efflux pump subunit AcrA (membrane-fusion protein)